MNSKYLFVLTLLIVIGLASCENDFELVAPGAIAAPVVHAIINKNDTAHYIRLEKTFVDQQISPVELAKDPNNLYFANPTVTIERIGGQTTTHVLEKVDGNTEGYVRDEGVFAQSPNTLYKLKLGQNEKLEGGDVINLEIATDELAEPSTGTTMIIDDLEIVTPSGDNEFGFNPEADFEIKFKDELDLAFLYDIDFVVHYEEKVGSEPFVPKSFTWRMATGFQPNFFVSRQIYESGGLGFYQALVDNISVATNEIRRIESFDVVITAYGEEINEFISVGNANTGITSAQIIPNYSNISGGRGILSSTIIKRKEGIPVSPATKAFLEDLDLVLPLNFQ